MKKARKHLNSKRNPVDGFFPGSKELIDQAMSKMDNLRKPKQSKKSALTTKKNIMYSKAKFFGEFLQKRISELSKQFPDIDNMNPFYLDLMKVILDTDRLKQHLAQLRASSQIIKKIRGQYGRRIYGAANGEDAARAFREMQGRLISVLKKLDPTLKELKIESKKLKEIPHIDFKLPTIVLAGYPNVGKSTMLKRLTGANAKISEYPFTTKEINSGYFELNYFKTQVLDTPGLLDREITNLIEEKAIAALRHLSSVIVFIVDPTLTSGYTLEQQQKLLESTKKKFEGKEIIIVLNKCDLATEKDIEAAEKALGKAIHEGENTSELKECLEKAMKGKHAET